MYIFLHDDSKKPWANHLKVLTTAQLWGSWTWTKSFISKIYSFVEEMKMGNFPLGTTTSLINECACTLRPIFPLTEDWKFVRLVSFTLRHLRFTGDVIVLMMLVMSDRLCDIPHLFLSRGRTSHESSYRFSFCHQHLCGFLLTSSSVSFFSRAYIAGRVLTYLT